MGALLLFIYIIIYIYYSGIEKLDEYDEKQICFICSFVQYNCIQLRKKTRRPARGAQSSEFQAQNFWRETIHPV